MYVLVSIIGPIIEMIREKKINIVFISITGMFRLSPHFCFIISFICDLFVACNDSWMFYHYGNSGSRTRRDLQSYKDNPSNSLLTVSRRYFHGCTFFELLCSVSLSNVLLLATI